MTSTELYINDQLADISADNPIAITYQVNNLSDLTDRQSTYSQAIKLVKSANNKSILGQAQSDAFTQKQPYQQLSATLVQNGVDQIVNGKLSLLRVTDYFECQLTYGISSFNDALSITETDPNTGLQKTRDAKLKDLDWSDIPNFNFDLATVVASQTGTGVLWPVIDYGGTLTNASEIDITYLRPGVYFYHIMQRIASFTGYSILGQVLSNSYYLTDFIPFSSTILYDYQGTDWKNTNLPLSVVNNLPDFSLKEVLKDFMQRYFLTPIIDNSLKTLTLRSFNELYDNITIAKDWTKKFVNEARQDEFIFGGYAQSNNLLWKTDQFALTNGNGIINVENENLELTADLLTSIFANTDYVSNVLGGQTVAKIIKFPESPLPNQGSFFTIDTEPRIINIRNAAAGTYRFYDTTSSMYSTAKIGLFWAQGNTTGIGYDNQILRFGSGLVKLLNKTRVITRYALLTPVDVQNFDFFVPIYDTLEAKYYYTNIISNFIAGQKTKIQLIRM